MDDYELTPYTAVQLGLRNEPPPPSPTIARDDSPPLTRGEWLALLEAETRRHRLRRADELERRGYRALGWDAYTAHEDDWRDSIQGDRLFPDRPMVASPHCDPRPSRDPLPVREWHQQRATACRERFDRLPECGTRERVVRGPHGVIARATLRCGHWRLCRGCASRRRASDQARFERGRRAQRERYRRQLARFYPGGRWSEKFVTLTVPHSGRLRADVLELSAAWKRFRRALKQWFGFDAKQDLGYWRSLEVGSTNQGHAHYHVWLLCPFIPRQVLAHLWGKSLSPDYRSRVPRVTVDAACEGVTHPKSIEAISACGAVLYAPVTDVRAANEQAGQYLVKYLVKDTVADGSLMEPGRYAIVYAALEGARGVATSRGFDVEIKRDKIPPVCECCGEPIVVTFDDICQAPRAVGPPKPKRNR